MQKPEQMDPLPSPELFPEVTFTDFNPTYSDLLANEPSPFRSVDEQTGEPVTRDPLMCVCLLQPYSPPPLVQETQQKAKARAVEQIADMKRLEKLQRIAEKKRQAELFK